MSTSTAMHQSAPQNPVTGQRVGLTIILFLFAALFFRSILPRLPRLFLGGRLRVKRFGVRGIRNVEWRSKGFKPQRKASDASDRSIHGESESVSDTGFHLKVNHIYMTLRWRRDDAMYVTDSDIDGGEGEHTRTRPSQAWLTVHVDGVGVTLPDSKERRSASEEEACNERATQAEEAGRKAEEEEERRLQELMISRPNSPAIDTNPAMLGGSGNAIAMPAFSAAIRMAQDRVEPVPDKVALPTMPLQYLETTMIFVRQTLIPALVVLLRKSVRTIAYLIASLLPLLSSIVDIDVRRIEIYDAQRDVVVRLGQVRLDAQLDIVGPTNKEAEATDRAAYQCASFQQRLASVLTSMSGKLGSGARGAASLVVDGMPGLHANLRLTTDGLQIFDAQRARQVYVSQSSSGSIDGLNSDRSRPSSNNLRSEQGGHEWQSFSSFASAPKLMRTLSTGDVMKESKKAARIDSRSRWSGRWVDWAFRSLPSGGEESNTNWYRGSTGCRQSAIATEARLLATQGATSVKLGLVIGKFVSSKESLHVNIAMAAITIGGEAALQLCERLKENDTYRDRTSLRSSPSSVSSPGTSTATLLQILGSVRFSMPLLQIDLSSKTAFEALASKEEGEEQRNDYLPTSLQAVTSLVGFKASLNTSSLPDDLHQRFLGSCGVEGFGAAAARKALTEGLRWTLGRKRLNYIEDRRVFALKAGLDAINVRLGVNGQSAALQSEIADISDLTVDARSTWSPAGLISAAKAPETGLLRFFAQDPNEEAIVLDAKLGSAIGNVRTAHLFALLAFIRNEESKRKRDRESSAGSFDNGATSSTSAMQKSRIRNTNMPRFVVGVEIRNIGYKVDASSLLPGDVGIFPADKKPYLGLVLEVPHLQLNSSSEYADQFVRRPENERKAAWRALARRELEWSLESSERLHPNTPNPNYVGNKASDEGKAQWRKAMFAGGEDSPPRPDGGEGLVDESQPLTMSEAIRRMQKLQEGEKDGSSQTTAATYQSKVRHKKQSAKLSARPDRRMTHSHLLKARLQFAFDSVKLFWVMDGADISSMRRAQDGKKRNTAFMDSLPSHAKTRRHIVGLHSFEALTNVCVPAQQDDASKAMTLQLDRRILDVCVSLGKVDLDMWHPSSVDATRSLLSGLRDSAKTVQVRPIGVSEARKRQGRQSDAAKLEDALSEEEGEQTQQQSQADNVTKPALIDILHGDTSVYLSVGSFISHIGGTDERCDRNLARGIGTEIKGLVVQIASSETDARRSAGPRQYALNSRSALGLGEDQRAAVAALAIRHGRAATAKLIIHDLSVFPILDAQIATAQHVDGDALEGDSTIRIGDEKIQSPSLIAPALWDFHETRPHASRTRQTRAKFRQQDRSNYIFSLPNIALRANLVPHGSKSNKVGKHSEELVVMTENTPLLSFKIELLHTYCILVALSSMKSLLPKSSKSGSEQKEEHDKPAQSIASRLPFAIPTHHATFTIDEVHVHVLLPSDVKIFLSFQRLEAVHSNAGEVSIGFEWLLAAVESAEVPSRGMWEELVRIRDCKVRYVEATEKELRQIVTRADGMRMRVPFNYVVHPIIDNTVVAVKATKQLLHQFLLDTKRSVIMPVAEGPKHLPVLDFKIRILSLEAEDDPFETRLNIIWRSGGDENQARAERESAFEQKLQALEKVQGPHNASQQSLSSNSAMTSSSNTSDSDMDNERLRKQAKTSVDEARDRLHAFNASSWKRRFTNAKAEQMRREDASKRRIYGRLPPNPCALQNGSLPIELVSPSRVAPLIRSSMTNLNLIIKPPTFAQSDLGRFLYEQGRGVPEDMQYSLLLPVNMHLRMDEWKVALRDYPMPLLHVPPINKHSQPDTMAALEVRMDCCIAEQLGNEEALRHVTAIVVPASTGRHDAIEYGISVPRMSMPTKFFGSPLIDINSRFTTRLVWGQSYQPAIHDVIRVLEGITSPPHDPSPKLGFWDKLPLILHGTLRIKFAGDGQFHVYLKGSRDPYHILGHGAGWVKCWRENVDIRVGFDNEQREVFQIISDEYILAIPDLKDYIDRAATGTESRDVNDEEASSSHDKSRNAGQSAATLSSSLISSQNRYMREPDFKKITLKLTNGVRWGFGLLLERTCTDSTCECSSRCKGEPFYRECRFWTRKPHWEVYTRSHEFVNTLPEEKRGDSYEGWRSHHLHFSVSIYSPADSKVLRRPKFTSGNSSAVNNLYFTPLGWEHFWAWMRLFDSALSLPIRQGSLFPRSLEQSPKFGRHLGTIKYRFDISPLYVSHVYPQDEKHDWARGRTTLIGVKARMSTFHMDLHQRQQEVVSDRPELGGLRKHFHKPFYEADIDLTDINFRTLAGQFQEPEKRLYPFHDIDDDDNDDDNIFDDDEEDDTAEENLEWYDMHDFVELDWAPPVGGKPPRVRLIEAMTCPRFNYYRRIDSKGERRERREQKNGVKKALDSDDDASRLENTKFGHENTHSCLVGNSDSPPKVQIRLACERLGYLKAQLDKHMSNDAREPASGAYMGDAKAREEDKRVQDKAKKRERDLKRKIKLVEEYLALLYNVEEVFERRHEPQSETKSTTSPLEHMAGLNPYTQELIREWEAFDNSYFIHNPVIFYSNATRDALLKYYMSSRKRRGVVHSLSARAVRYIRNLADSADEAVNGPLRQERIQSTSTIRSDNTMQASKAESQESDDDDANARRRPYEAMQGLDGAVQDTMDSRPFGELDGKESDSAKASQGKSVLHREDSGKRASMDSFDPHEGISEDFEVRRSNVCVVLKPQIVLRSLISDTSTVIITAARARLHNYSVIDPRMEEDSVNERVLYRNLVGVDALQGFHPSAQCTFTTRARERHGFVYVPLETLVDMRHETSEFDRIAPRTDATVQYDKFNKLRMHDPNHPVFAVSSLEDEKKHDPGRNDHLRHAMDLIRVRCPRYSISANADQFGAIYNVVTDLLLYRDPAYREHAKKLDMMMFNYDLSDISALADIVQSMQVRVRHARELHTQYQLHFESLNEHGRLDFLTLKAELHEMQDDLNLLLEAITQAADHSDKDKEKNSALRLDAQANDVAWNMMGGEEGELLAKLSIRGASFTWLNKADNSVVNSLSVMDLNAVNVDPDAVFQEIITKYHTNDEHPMKESGMLVNASWSVLAPVGGIAMIDRFELHIHPLRIQIERRVGRQIEDYIFGSMREKRREREEQEEVQRQQDNNNAKGKRDGEDEEGRKRSVSMRLKRLKGVFQSGNQASGKHATAAGKDSGDRTDASGPPSPQKINKSLPPSRQSNEFRRSMNLHRVSSRHSLVTDDGRPARSASFLMSSNASSLGGTTLASGGSTSALNSGDDGLGAGVGVGQNDGDSDEENGQRAIAIKNALEMRERASRNVTFVSVKVSGTIFCLSYKSEKQKSIMDLYDLEFRAPRLDYRNRTWTHADLASHLKKDIIKAAWRQRSTLIKGVISHKRPPATQRVAQAALTLARSRPTGMPSLGVRSHSPSVSDEKRRLFKSGTNDEAPSTTAASSGGRSSGERSHRRKSNGGELPQFRYHIDPPSFSDSDSRAASASGMFDDSFASKAAAEHREGQGTFDETVADTESLSDHNSDSDADSWDAEHDEDDDDHREAYGHEGDDNGLSRQHQQHHHQRDYHHETRTRQRSRRASVEEVAGGDGVANHDVLSDVGEEVEAGSSMAMSLTRSGDRASIEQQSSRLRFGSADISRHSSKSSGNGVQTQTSSASSQHHHSVPGAAVAFANNQQQKLGRLLAKTLHHKRKGDHSPTHSTSAAVTAAADDEREATTASAERDKDNA